MARTTRAASWLLGRPGPYVVNFEPTLRCNARCEFCNVWRENLYPHESHALLSRLEEAWRMGCRICAITGGEPTLREDLGDYVKGAKMMGYYTTLVTNGIRLVDPEVMKRLRGVDFLAISFVCDKWIFNETRGVNAYNDVVEGILQARDLGMKPKLFCTISKEVLPAVKMTTDFAQWEGLDVYYNIVTPIEIQGVDKIDWASVMGDQAKIVDVMKAEAKRYRGVKLNRPLLEMKMTGGFNAHVRCLAAETTVSLKPDGSVVLPCSILNNWSIKPDESLEAEWKTPMRLNASKFCGHFEKCKGCGYDCMYQASLLGHPIESFKWLFGAT